MKQLVAISLMLTLSACGAAAAEERHELPPSDPLNGVDPEVLFHQGEQLASEGDLVRAEQYMSAAIDRGYSEEQGLPLLIRVCVNASRIRAALDYATPALIRHPSNWRLRYVVASLQLGLGHPDVARDELVQVIATAPDQADPHYLLAVTLADELEDPTNASLHFARYVQLAPNGEHAEESRARIASLSQTTQASAVQASPVMDGGTP